LDIVAPNSEPDDGHGLCRDSRLGCPDWASPVSQETVAEMIGTTRSR
jgi:hypothetical protein